MAVTLTAPAAAATLVFDFGLIAPNSGPACTPVGKKCVLTGAAEQFFTTGGVTVGAIGFNTADAIAYVTQKTGTFSGTGDETGLGESNSFPKPSDPDFEVTTKTWLLIDNSQALAAHYLSATFSIESLQRGEGARVYAYTGSLTALDETKLALLASVSNPGTAASGTQTIAVPNYSKYLVVQAYKPAGGSSGSDIVVAQEVQNTAAVTVPEPATWALMLGGFGLIGAAMRRRSPAPDRHPIVAA